MYDLGIDDRCASPVFKIGGVEGLVIRRGVGRVGCYGDEGNDATDVITELGFYELVCDR